MGKPLKNINWEAIKMAAIGGVPLQKLSEMNPGVTFENLKVRAGREKWPLPAKVRAVTKLLPEALSNEIAMQTIAEQLAQNGDQGSLIASQIALKALYDAQKSKAGILPLLNIGDVKTALSTVRTAAGMDKATNAIQINVGKAWQSSVREEEPCVVVE